MPTPFPPPSVADGLDPGTAGGHAWHRTLVAAVALGMLLRVLQYAQFRGFWGDEAFILLNVLEYGPGRLVTGPLDAVQASQVSPPLFSLALDALAGLFGPAEWAMRLPALLAALATVPLFARLVWHVAPGAPAAMTTLLFAVSFPPVFQAANVKHYSFDMLVAIGLCLAVLGSRPLALGLVAAVGVWLSTTTMLVAPVALAAAWYLAPDRRRGWSACVAAFVVSAGLMYLVSLGNMKAEDLGDFWAGGFVPWDRPWLVPVWLVQRIVELATYGFKPAGAVILVPVAIALVAARTAPPAFRAAVALGAGPVALNLLAAAVHAYPFQAARVTIYLLPGTLLLTALGLAAWGGAVAGLPERTRRLHRAAAVTVLALCLGSAAWTLLDEYIAPFGTRNLGPGVRHLLASRAPDEPVYVPKDSAAIARVYLWGRDTSGFLFDRASPTTRPASAGPRGVWVLATYDPHRRLPKPLRDLLDSLGTPDTARSGRGPGWIAAYFPHTPGPATDTEHASDIDPARGAGSATGTNPTTRANPTTGTNPAHGVNPAPGTDPAKGADPGTGVGGAGGLPR